jgi:hypothetical protein
LAKVTFLLGLAGSGKSFLAEQLKMETGAEIFEGIAGSHNSGMLLTMVQHLRDGKNCIVEEIAYCHPHAREKVITYLRSQVPNVKIKWICFENNLESANWNVRHRKNKGDIEGHLAINRNWHSLYQCPDGATVIQIKRVNENNPAA